MTWRLRMLMLGAGLCLCFLPACRQMETRGEASPPVSVGKQTVAEKVAKPVSPRIAQAAPKVDKPVEPVVYPLDEADIVVMPALTVSVERKEPETPPAVQETQARVPEEPLLAALRCLLEKNPAQAVEWLKHYDKASQDLLLTLLPLANRLAETPVEKNNPGELAAILEQLENLAKPLRARSALNIKKMCFCRSISIKGYGEYKELPLEYEFQPGEQISAYVELGNFSSELQGSEYVTKLTGSIKIRDFEGKVVWHEERRWKQDRSLALRHDFFINCPFRLPANLPPGRYTFFIHIEDVPTGRTINCSTDFQVMASGSARGS